MKKLIISKVSARSPTNSIYILLAQVCFTGKAMAEAFQHIESWGTGIRRMIEDYAQLKLPEPVFTEIGDAFRVEIYRKQTILPATGQASTEQVTEERIKELVEYCSTPRN